MAARTEHPGEIEDLRQAIERADPDSALTTAQTWLRRHPMPLIGKRSVSFVHCDPNASEVYVGIAGKGFWTAYDVPRLVPDLPVFAVSLKREEIPDGTVYRLDVVVDQQTSAVVDPHARTVTSRGGQPVAVVAGADPTRGRIVLVRNAAASSGAPRPRDLYVYLPPGYDAHRQRRYPVLYLHDGQNCWDDPTEPFGHGGWRVNTLADLLVSEGKVRPFIAVGVPNTPDRMREYGPGANILSAGDHAYLRYLVHDVKPLIDGRFRTKPGPAETAIMGSSMGGIVSLQAGLLRPDVFGGVGCLSPALWFEDDRGRNYFDLLAGVGKVPVRIYLDSGTAGPAQDGAPATRRLGKALLDTGWKDGVDLLRFEDTGAEHNERAWRARLHRPLVFLFGQ